MSSAASAVVGMIGGGQLSRMTHQAAIALGIDLHVLADGPEAPAAAAGATPHLGGHEDLDAVLAFARQCDVVTLDHELTPAPILRALVDEGHVVRPHPDAARFAQDKGVARVAFAEAGLPVPAFILVDRGQTAEVTEFAAEHGWPFVLKAPTGGYDGRGVEVIDDAAALERSELAANSGRWLVEAAVPIEIELAVLVARRPSGETRLYPVVETVQTDGICTELITPARIPADLADQAASLARRIAEMTGATGILAVEMFLTHDGELIVNEIATRPHNSGHITIESAATSQFENHLRAVLDWPLGSTESIAPASATVNVLGPLGSIDLAETVPRALEVEDAHLHLYRKVSRPGRKIGHVTARASTIEDARAAAHECVERLVGR